MEISYIFASVTIKTISIMVTDVKLEVREILSKYDLDFRIEKLKSVALRDGMALNSDGEFVDVVQNIETPYYMLYNDKSGEILNSVKKGYTVSQNDEILELMLLGIRELPTEYQGSLSVHKAGSINGGRKVFLQLSVEGDGSINGDKIKRYITLIDSNDGTTGLSVGVGNLTMSCQNQFHKFYKDGLSKFKHTNSLNVRKFEIKNMVERQLRHSFDIVKTYEEFDSIKLGKNDIRRAIENVYGYDILDKELGTRVQNNIEVLMNDINTEISDKGNTVWGLFSGFTKWSTHSRKAPKRANGRLESLVLSNGTNYAMNSKAFDFSKSLVY